MSKRKPVNRPGLKKSVPQPDSEGTMIFMRSHAAISWCRVLGAFFCAVGATVIVGVAPSSPVAAAGETWIDTLNSYRYAAGVQTVTADDSLNAGALNHSCYMQRNNIITHNENPALPGYTPNGAQAGRNGVLDVANIQDGAATPRQSIERLLSAPLHAMTMLSPYTSKVGYGACSEPSEIFAESYTLDVTSSTDYTVATPTTPIRFPAAGSTIAMNHYEGETPELVRVCNDTFRARSGTQMGIPAWVIMPQPVTGAVNVTWTQPDGTPMPTCVVTQTNAHDEAKSAIGNTGIVIFALYNQAPGNHTINVTAGTQATTWTYTTQPGAPLGAWTPRSHSGTVATTSMWAGGTTGPVGAASGYTPITPFRFADSRSNQRVTRLAAQTPVRLQISGQADLGADITAVSANFTAVGATQPGFLTVYDCSASVPEVSTLNYMAGGAVGNQAVTPLDPTGGLCLYAHTNTDIIVDINGTFAAGGTQLFNPVAPSRILDTRRSIKITPNAPLRISATQPGTGVPATAAAVALSVVATAPDTAGFLRITPCNTGSGVSNLNFDAGQTIANSVIVNTATGGDICIETHTPTHVIVDINGYFAAAGYRYQALRPTRVFDTRRAMWAGDPRFADGAWSVWKLAATGGIPANAKAVSVNLTSVSSPQAGYLTAWDCSTRQETSTVNYDPSRGATGNGAMLKLSDTGELCVFAHRATHVLLDINGVWI